jgi:hypothetical protein
LAVHVPLGSIQTAPLATPTLRTHNNDNNNNDNNNNNGVQQAGLCLAAVCNDRRVRWTFVAPATAALELLYNGAAAGIIIIVVVVVVVVVVFIGFLCMALIVWFSL